MKIKYDTTRYECLKRINGVCPSCGGKLSALRTVNNSGTPTFWGGCKKCQQFSWGVDKKIWKLARYLVKERNWKPYNFVEEGKSNKDKGYYLRSQTRGAIYEIYDVINGMKKLKITP